VLVKAASLALAVHDPAFPGCNRTPTCSIRFCSASSTAPGRALDGSARRRQAACEAVGSRRAAFGGAELAQQLEGGLVGDAEAGARRVAGDRLPVLVLVLGGGPGARTRAGPRPHRPGPGMAVLARTARRRRRPCRRLLGGGWRAARRSIMETATRLSSTPPASTTVGHDSRRVTVRAVCHAVVRGQP